MFGLGVRSGCVGSAVFAVVTEPDPWGPLVARHGRVVWLSILALGVPPDQAREIAQAAWARLVEQHASGALAELRMPGLVLAQARFLALDALRRLRSEHRHLAEAAADDVDLLDPERQVIARERLGRALGALGRCSFKEQQIVRAVYDDPSRSHAEIAAEVKLSVQRVRQVLCEVRRKLRAAMET